MPSDVNTPARRLENIQSVQPYIEALKTISLSRWKTSVNRRQRMALYSSELDTTFQIIRRSSEESTVKTTGGRTIVILGSDQGFCGSLNRSLFDHFIQSALNDSIPHSRLYVNGRKLQKIFVENHIDPEFFHPLENNESENIDVFDNFIRDKVTAEQTSLEVLSFDYLAAGQGQIGLRKIIPPETLPPGDATKAEEYFIDTNVNDLRNYLTQRLSVIHFYQTYLSAVAYENSLRYQIMENASNNADDLIDELQIQVQADRRQKITSEIRELAVSAGLLEKE